LVMKFCLFILSLFGIAIYIKLPILDKIILFFVGSVIVAYIILF